jgi:hypothetical protein
MVKKFLTQQEKIHLRNLKNRGQRLTKEAKENIFGKSYNPNFNYNTNQIEKK